LVVRAVLLFVIEVAPKIVTAEFILLATLISEVVPVPKLTIVTVPLAVILP
tara:strand:+ start:20854 stop:21006 length:153 start_codon:yes stop_codon:yes gene_type:complete